MTATIDHAIPETAPACVLCKSFPFRCHDCLCCQGCCSCGLPTDPKDVPRTHRRTEPEYQPTREQIEAECERIREAWTPRERAKRSGGIEVVAWSVPTASTGGRVAEPRD